MQSLCKFYFQRYNKQTKTSTNEDVTMMDVYKEFNEEIAEHYKILQYKSRKVERNYAFSIQDVPVTSEYLEIVYPVSKLICHKLLLFSDVDLIKGVERHSFLDLSKF
jgi:hypothetical protein